KNGAGKSTLIRILTGISIATNGDFYLFGDHEPKNLSSHLKEVTAIIEAPALIEKMSGKDNLKYACLMKGMKDFIKSGYIKEKMDFVGLGNLYESDKAVSKYSLGMRQRLSIAIALIGEPKIMVLDEPTNGLDPEGIKDIRDLLTRINRENQVTMIISSHILSELEKFATSYLFIEKGRLVGSISASDMENSSGKSMSIITNDNQKALKLLKDNSFVTTEIENMIKITNIANPTDILNLIYAQGFTLSYLKEEENSLEDYYLKVTGGLRND
ncbi:MAG: ABC transporter ATP-binding protein, partial [Bacilli bacterium]